jgi:hypothetical protein
MAKLALALSLIALAISVLAYREAIGTRTSGASLESLEKAMETVRQETADALARIERALRPADEPGRPAPKPKP